MTVMKDNADELLPLVDEAGRVIGRATRGVCHGPTRPLHPVVHLHVFDPAGGLYLQKRPDWKDIQPGRWDTAVGGHVDWGETIDEALRREVREEIGLTDFEPEQVATYVFECERERELVHVFRTVTTTAPSPSTEVAGGRFFARRDIIAALGTGLFTPNFEQEWRRFFGNEIL